ncbi:MAG: hypothetical protein HYX87_03810 [Chloroflexi bacterium]|nr:hypothetical protein [Chloroflexota bacterium]
MKGKVSLTRVLVTITLVLGLAGAVLGGSCAKPSPSRTSIGTPASTPTTKPASAPATKPVVLKLSNYITPVDYRSSIIDNTANVVEQRSGGRIKIERFHGGSLLSATETYNGVRDRIADIGVFVWVYFSGQAPFLSDTFSPFFPRTDKSHEFVPELTKLLLPYIEKQNLKLLTIIPGVGNDIQFTTPIRKLEDFKGKLSRAGGGIISKWMQNVGASVVSVPVGEVYSALQRKTMCSGSRSVAASSPISMATPAA